MSDCECPVAGYCPRHKRRKTTHTHKLCQTRPDYRALWDRLAAGIAPDPADDLYRDGPGTKLHGMLKRFGIEEEPDCPCRSRMLEMNQRGCQWCRENLDTIIGWLREEAGRRGLPFLEWPAKRLVLKAIRQAEADSLSKSNPAEE